MKPLPFAKMHGIGNDYVYVDAREGAACIADPPSLARAVSDRHTGVGGDGLILVAAPSAGCDADARMRIFNADGSEAQMCGNGVRCVAKFVVDRAIAQANPLRIETGRGVLSVRWWRGTDGTVAEAEVAMGEPVLDAAAVPAAWPGVAADQRIVGAAFTESMWREALAARGLAWDIAWWHEAGMEPVATVVSMGNPHAVFWCRSVGRVPVERVGAAIEHHAFFPQRTNVHFAQVLAPGHLRMRTWERGSGVTLACGTGASAVLVAGVLEGRCARRAEVDLPGGRLQIAWDERTGQVLMRGPATHAFDGAWPCGS